MDASGQNISGLLGRLLGRGSTSGTERLAALVRFALMVFVVVAMVYAATSYYITTRVSRQGDLGAISIQTQAINRYYMEMRALQLEFLAEGKKEMLDDHKVWYERVMAVIGSALANPQAGEYEKDLTALQRLIEDTRQSFIAMGNQSILNGLDENSGLQGAHRKAVHAIEETISAQQALELEVLLLQLRRHEKDFLLRRDETYLSRFAQTMNDMQRAIRNAKFDDVVKQVVRKDLEVYDKNFQELAAGLKEITKLRAPGPAREAEIDKLTETLAAATAASRQSAVNQSLTTVGTSAAALLAILAVIGYLLWSAMKAADATLAERLAAQQKAEAENEQLNNSVISILQAVHQLSQRDLTVRAPVTTDVIGTVSDSINSLAGETSKVLQGVSQIAGQVALATGKVRTQADLVSQTAEEERLGVTAMINSLADATQTMNQVAALAEQSNLSAESATKATDTALETVNGTVKGMESIRETIAETEKRIKRLGERSQEISGIVNLINTIAERTHVLALNAAMQAAVAGEAGRGFAVVAEEVQRLAESSRNATQQIGTLVNNIQLETNETINTVNRTINQVVQGSEQAQRAGEQMRTTQEMTGNLVAQVRRIALASEQQKEMSVNLLESVQRIGQSAERTAQQIATQNQETLSLEDSARQLVSSVNVFKLPALAA